MLKTEIKCKCGCGRNLIYKYSFEINKKKFYSVDCISKFNKGKTWVELFGKDKAERFIRLKKGKTYEEMYGGDKANKMKENLSKLFKGKTLEERLGRKKARKLSRRGKTLEEICGKEKADEIRSLRKGKTWKEIFGNNKTKEMKRKLSICREGESLEKMYGKKKAKELKKNLSKRYKGKSHEERFGKKKARELNIMCSNNMINFRKSGKFVVFPNKDETKLIKLIKKYNLPYTYTGNGKYFWIENINPDFKCTNARKVIEYFSDYWKINSYGSVRNFKNHHNRIFKRNNWTGIYINQKELKRTDKYLLNKLGR